MATISCSLRGAAMLALFIACAPSEPAPPAPPSSAHSSGAEQANAAPSTAASKPAEETEDLSSYMVEHFVIVTYARDAVIAGKVTEMRRALGALADYKYEHVTPGDWQPWIAKLQAAARPAKTAKTLLEASQAIANTAAVCGECHVAGGSGPNFPTADGPEPDSGLSNTLSERMERHAWAADRMWEGLIAPSDEAWHEGVSELSTLPSKAPADQPTLSPEFARELRAVRALGAEARNTHDSSGRAALYARVLTTCAGCHERELKSTF
jgi:mono/diheme cytochrome c family protein